MLKKIVYLTSTVIILGLAVYWYTNHYGDPLVENTEKLKEEVKTLQEDASAMTDGTLENPSAVSLLVKSFVLSQGEKGFTLWRLTASAGNMSKKGSIFTVESPFLAYNMDDGSQLTVVSKSGDIDQANKKMRFIDDVTVKHKDQNLSGELLVYDGNEKTMTFPDPASFADSQVSGSADKVVWFIDSRLIEGTGNIHVTFSSPKELKSKK